jgi:UDPglucose 6-dehydrogenase
MVAARRAIGDVIRYAESSYDALEGADALVIVTDWNEYRHPDFTRMKAALRHPVVIDSRNLYRPERMKSFGFIYDSIGRGPAAEAVPIELATT